MARVLRCGRQPRQQAARCASHVVRRDDAAAARVEQNAAAPLAARRVTQAARPAARLSVWAGVSRPRPGFIHPPRRLGPRLLGPRLVGPRLLVW